MSDSLSLKPLATTEISRIIKSFTDLNVLISSEYNIIYRFFMLNTGIFQTLLYTSKLKYEQNSWINQDGQIVGLKV